MNESKKINVQMIAPMCPYKEFGGGIVTFIRSLINQLSNKFDFRLIGITFDNVNNNVKLDNITFCPIATFKIDDIGNKSSVKYGIALFKAKKSLDKSKTIFHVHKVDSAFPLLYPIRVKNPVIIHIHGSNTYWKYLGKTWIFRIFYYFCEYLVIKRANKIIMVSKKGLNEYHNIYPKFKEKIIYIPNGVNVNKFYPIENKKQIRRKFNISEKEKVILYTGRFVKEKGIDLLLNSFEIITNHIDNVLFLIIGEGSFKYKIKEFEKNNKNIVLLSSVSNEKMPGIYNLADILVMASYFEGWSMTMGEALACGLPVVTTNVGDAEEIIEDGKNGYVVNTRSPQDFSEKCILAIKNSYKMRGYARKTVIPYSVENMASQVGRVFKGVLS